MAKMKTNSNNMELLKNKLGSKAKKVQEETEKENISSDLILQHVTLNFEADPDTLNYLKDRNYSGIPLGCHIFFIFPLFLFYIF